MSEVSYFDRLPPSRLHRAYVSLPDALCERDHPLQERVVFFEVSGAAKPYQHLEQLLALAWNVDTSEWTERGYIYNLYSARELFDQNISVAPLLRCTDDLRLFECGWGGREGIGTEHIHFSRTANCDLFVTPRVHARLAAALSEIERLYAAEPSRRAALAGAAS